MNIQTKVIDNRMIKGMENVDRLVKMSGMNKTL